MSSSILSRSASFSSMAALSCLASSAVTLGSVDDAAISAFHDGVVLVVVHRLRAVEPLIVVVVVVLPRGVGADELLPLEQHAVVLERGDEEALVAMLARRDPFDGALGGNLRLGVVGAGARTAVLGDCSGVVERHDGAVEVQAVSRGELAQVEAEGVGGVREGGGGTRVRPGAEEASGAALALVLLLVPVGEVALLAIVVFVVAHRGVLRAYPGCGDGPAVGPMCVGGLMMMGGAFFWTFWLARAPLHRDFPVVATICPYEWRPNWTRMGFQSVVRSF